ncbi:MAG TPA: GIY-YIG nuclease family protein [Candidatus Pacearchaeota archaeon]|nr:GIY-YIG nuclease family protein [Candidatus Pacearchaeota archaeon]
MYYVYVLQSAKDKKLYTGYTKDLKLRFKLHSKGRVASTKNRLPIKIIYYEACIDRIDAMRRELYLKSSFGKSFLKKRLKSYFTGPNK